MKEKLKTIWWFFKNPKYIAQINQVRKRKKNQLKEDTAEESVSWCNSKKITQQEALLMLTGSDEFIELNDLFPEIMMEAKKQETLAPVKMGGEGATSFLFHLINKNKYQSIIETGVAYGWSSLAILLAIQDTPDGKLISNDMPYIKMNNEDSVGCVVPEKLKNSWDLQRSADINGIPKALNKFNQQIDCCHYDSDKSYTGRMFAYPLLWQAMSEGGVFISDDIQDNVAFKDFFEEIKIDTIVIEHLGKFVGIAKK